MNRLAFSRHWPGVVLGIAFCCFFLIGAGLVAAPHSASDTPFGLGLMVVCAWLSYRSFRGAGLVVDNETLRARGLLRTRRWDVGTVRKVDVAVSRVGLYERAFICVELAGRSPFRFTQFNTSPRRRGDLEQLAAGINTFLAGGDTTQQPVR